MIANLNKSLLIAVQPQSLKQLWEQVLHKPLPPISDRGVLYEKYGLGPADDYIGSAPQNLMLLGAIMQGAA